MSLVLRVVRDLIARLGARALAATALPRASWGVLLGTLAGTLRLLSSARGPRDGRDDDDLASRRASAARVRRETWRQMEQQGNRSLVFVVVTLGFIGMVMSYQACLQISRITGDTSQVGPQYLRLVVSDFGATLTAMMLSTRVGAGIAAELGSMKVTEQLDALRMSGVSPIEFLIVPRFWA
jgi:Permease MlaE